MNRTIIFKGIALTNFVVLVTAFLLYRSGSLDAYLHDNTSNSLTSPNGGAAAKASKDSAKTRADSLRRLRLSSSKSLVIADDQSVLSNTQPVVHLDSFIKASSTKPAKVVHLDSFIKADTARPAKDTGANKAPDEESIRMFSSKSAIIVEPRLFEPRVITPDSASRPAKTRTKPGTRRK